MKRLFLLLSVFAVMAYGQTISTTGTPLAGFGNVVVNTNSSELSFNVSAAGLAELDAITVTAPTGFEVSATSGSGFTSTINVGSADQLGDIASTTVYVRFSPTTTGAFSDNITLTGGAAPTVNVAVTGTALAAEPTTAASSFTFTPVRATTIKINWTNGDGAGRIVVVRATSAVDFTPSDATAYTANTNFTLGSAVGTACKVVYNGTGSSTVVTNLSASTTYHVSIFEYNGSSTTINYAAAATGSQATTAATALTGPTYTIGASGDFPTFSGAIAELNASGVAAALTFTLEDASYTESANVSLGYTGGSSTNTVTIKPASGVTASITFTDGTSSASIDGHFVIGSPNALNTNLVSTNYLIIDGSNNGTTTKNLTINGPTTASQRSVIRIFGNSDFNTIKNCTIIDNSTSGSSTAPIMVTNFNASSVNYTPDSIYIVNNTLTGNSGNGALGVQFSNSGTPTTYVVGAIVKNNIITARATRAVMFNYVGSGDVTGNTISHDCQLGTGAAATIYLTTAGSSAGTFNINANKITKAKTWNTTAGPAASNGIIMVDNQLVTPKVVNVYNNYFAGFEINTTTVQGVKMYAVRHTSTSTSNVYHNSVHIPEMTNMTTTTNSFIAAFAFASAAATEASPSGTMNVKNNIIFSSETSLKVYGIRRVGTGGTFTSDYNNVFHNSTNANAFFGFDNASDRVTLSDWITNTAYDDHSKNDSVTFVSATNLSLSGGSIGNSDLIAVTGLGITTDIDGDSRHVSVPYMGADEASPALPVELTSFTAVARGKNVELKWTTATEVNNHGFEVERMSNGAWGKIGFVQGAGNSNAPKEYSYTDAGLSNGTVLYRLKQIDANGSFTYNNAIEIVVNTTVTRYELSQNFPNPFNPTTTIRFALPTAEQASVKVYDMAGREVAELFNQVAAAGQVYNVQFTGSGLASGIYLYVLQTASYREVRKMSLLK